MQPSRAGRTRTAPPSLPDKFPFAGRYLVYTLFDLTGIVYFVVGFGILRLIWGARQRPGGLAVADASGMRAPADRLPRVRARLRRVRRRALLSALPEGAAAADRSGEAAAGAA